MIQVNGFGTPVNLFQGSVMEKINEAYESAIDLYDGYGLNVETRVSGNGFFVLISDDGGFAFEIELSATVIQGTNSIVYTVLSFAMHDECSEQMAVMPTLAVACEHLYDYVTQACEILVHAETM